MQVELKNVSFSYAERKVLDNVSFTVDKGSLTAVLGPNGAGKSTLFCCMLGIQRTYFGQILLEGREASTIGRREFSRLAAYIPQNSDPVYNYPVIDTVLMGITGQLGILQSPKREAYEAARKALERLGILDLADRGIACISGGERQLALIARAIVQDAKILIMDEPTANLDYGNQHRVLTGIRALADEGYSILMSTHNPEHALRYATDVLALQNGRAIASGKTDEVLNEKLLKELYGLPVIVTQTELSTGSIRTCIPDL